VTRDPHRIHEWFREISREVQESWERLHAAALADPQKAGHGGEATWALLLGRWLPSSYEVATRKYILPETDYAPEPQETDIVIFSPGYPEALRDREEVLAGGVAAAFNVRLTLSAEGIRDGTSRAVKIRRHLDWRYGSVRVELLGPFPVGLLAHSHSWKNEASAPLDNVTAAFVARDDELARHPRECLDFICVADLGMWRTTRTPWTLKDGSAICYTAAMAEMDPSPTPVASFVTHLLRHLSYADPSLRQMAEGLGALHLDGSFHGRLRRWELDHVFGDEVRGQLPARLQLSDADWLRVYF
jgi:hypothetical protein